LYELTVPQLTKMLHNLSHCLDRAAAFAESKKFDSGVLLRSRLAPDQFDLIRQVQIACDNAKNGVARLTGTTAPNHEDNEKTLEELKARIDKAIAFVRSVPQEAFLGASARHCSQPRWAEKYLTGDEYVVQYLLPNFYFHVTTAYAILRHNGVELGKKDFLGELPYKAPAA